jgi:hypothetical protein
VVNRPHLESVLGAIGEAGDGVRNCRSTTGIYIGPKIEISVLASGRLFFLPPLELCDAIVVEIGPEQAHLPVKRGRSQVGRRRRALRRGGYRLGRGAGPDVVIRPDLERIGGAVGQAGYRVADVVEALPEGPAAGAGHRVWVNAVFVADDVVCGGKGAQDRVTCALPATAATLASLAGAAR